MKRSIITLIAITIIIVSLLYSLQYIVNTGLRKSYYQQYQQWSDIYAKKINADIILLGSSRTCVMLSPKILDSILNVETYNMGFNGWTIDMQYFRFKEYLKNCNKKPKYVVQNVDVNLFIKRSDLYSFEQFLPYIDKREFVDQTNNYTGKFSLAEIYFPMFRYNNKIDLIKEGWKSYFGYGAKPTFYKGYQTMDIGWDTSVYTILQHKDSIPSPITQEMVTQLNEDIILCKQNGIKLIFDYAPIYYETYQLMQNREQVKTLIKQIAKKNNIPFLDFSDDSLSYNKEYFYNSMHLNKKGTEIFSNKIGIALKKVLETY